MLIDGRLSHFRYNLNDQNFKHKKILRHLNAVLRPVTLLQQRATPSHGRRPILYRAVSWHAPC